MLAYKNALRVVLIERAQHTISSDYVKMLIRTWIVLHFNINFFLFGVARV